MSVGQRQSHITRMPDNSDVQSRYMQVADSYGQDRRAKLSDSQAKKIFRAKRNTIGNTADVIFSQKTPVVLARGEALRSGATERERAEEHLRAWMNATRRNENFAEYNACINTTSNAASVSANVNLEFIAKLRSNKAHRRRGNSHLQTPTRFKEDANPEEGRQSPTSRDYSEKHVPKVYYKPNPSESRPDRKEYDYKGNF